MFKSSLECPIDQISTSATWEPIMSRFIDNGDDTVTDTQTNLVWQQRKTALMTFKKAQEYAESLRLANHEDWRLPTIQELLTLVDYEQISPAADPIFECCLDGYWSGTAIATYPDFVWGVNFDGGYGGWYSKVVSNYVRCVRDERAKNDYR